MVRLDGGAGHGLPVGGLHVAMRNCALGLLQKNQNSPWMHSSKDECIFGMVIADPRKTKGRGLRIV